MSRTPSLRAVEPGEVAPTPQVRSVSDAAENGTQLELLVALRARVAKAVQNEDTPPRDLAALTRRLQDIARDIESIKARDEQEAERHAAASDGAFDATAI